MFKDLTKTDDDNEIFVKKFYFGAVNAKEGYINIANDMLFAPEIGYGFVTESVKENNEILQIPELGSAFDIQQSLIGQTIANIHIKDTAYIDKSDVPMCFRVKVPHSGNYNIKLTLGNSTTDSIITVFSERRRCVLRNKIIKAGEFIEYTFTANVCDIIPRGKTEVYHDDGLDIAIIGQNASISELIVEEALDSSTIFIAGDSTVTDQSAQYPYNPAISYCGWAQMLPMFLKKGISVSNHAHSGLTTNSFRREGHWSIVKQNIKPNDTFFIQFGHNDQKDKNLDPFGGYAENLRTYVDEVRTIGAYPVIITPVSRTIWNGYNNSFNDMLKDYAVACKEVAKEKDVPLIDLHGKSVNFILKHGSKASTKYFYPKDWTHHNDFGGYEMAKLVVDSIKEANIKPIIDYLNELPRDFIHEQELQNWKEPNSEDQQEQYKQWLKVNQWAQQFTVPEYKDIENHWAKSAIETAAKFGITKGIEDKFLPEKELNRVEFFEIILKALRYSPTNVYNDMFEDIFGDEWYAGIIQSAYDNDLIPTELVVNKNLKPKQPLSLKEAFFIMNYIYNTKFNEEFLINKDLRILQPDLIITKAVAAVLVKSLIDKFK